MLAVLLQARLGPGTGSGAPCAYQTRTRWQASSVRHAADGDLEEGGALPLGGQVEALLLQEFLQMGIAGMSIMHGRVLYCRHE
jgi:hypothetical protein